MRVEEPTTARNQFPRFETRPSERQRRKSRLCAEEDADDVRGREDKRRETGHPNEVRKQEKKVSIRSKHKMAEERGKANAPLQLLIRALPVPPPPLCRIRERWPEGHGPEQVLMLVKNSRVAPEVEAVDVEGARDTGRERGIGAAATLAAAAKADCEGEESDAELELEAYADDADNAPPPCTARATGVDAGKVLAVAEAGLEGAIFRIIGGVVGAADAVVDVLANLGRVGAGGITDLEGELVPPIKLRDAMCCCLCSMLWNTPILREGYATSSARTWAARRKNRGRRRTERNGTHATMSAGTASVLAPRTVRIVLVPFHEHRFEATEVMEVVCREIKRAEVYGYREMRSRDICQDKTPSSRKTRKAPSLAMNVKPDIASAKSTCVAALGGGDMRHARAPGLAVRLYPPQKSLQIRIRLEEPGCTAAAAGLGSWRSGGGSGMSAGPPVRSLALVVDVKASEWDERGIVGVSIVNRYGWP
ncbi:hypothetical protein B0H13DRAFT_2265400 [Mycena leptocephala]|nr:hypothetical protein B0H13DRAFT_2265400 [Mycena leptocephala]